MPDCSRPNSLGRFKKGVRYLVCDKQRRGARLMGEKERQGSNLRMAKSGVYGIHSNRGRIHRIPLAKRANRKYLH